MDKFNNQIMVCIIFILYVHTNFNIRMEVLIMSKSKDIKSEKKNNSKGSKKSNPKQDTNAVEGK